MSFIKRALPLMLPFAAAVPVAPVLAAPALDSADTRAIVITPLSLLKVDDLDFGSLVPSATSGVVMINATTGAQSAIGGVSAYDSANSHRAYFVGAGTEGQPVVITLGTAPTLTDGDGNSMDVISLSLDGPPLRFIPADRVVHIYVGGILSVNADQAQGDYSGEFEMTVNYF